MEDVYFVEELEFLEKLENRKKRNIGEERINFMEKYDDFNFKKRFRLGKESVIELLKIVGKKLEHGSTLNNALSPLEQLLIALRYYACGSFQLLLADLFQVSQPTVCRVVNRVSKALASLRKDLIYLPRTDQECKEVSKKFVEKAGFPGVIGAIDGTHMRILSPGGEDAERFRNRKGYFSLNVQTISDADLYIRNVVARWPGSAHDSTIFTNSAVCLDLQRNSVYKHYHLLGDSGYACQPFLLTPILKPRSPAEISYNKSHVLTRNTVERSYGILKRRFPCLQVGLSCHIDNAPTMIVACCVLHNIALDLGDPEPPADPEVQLLLLQLEASCKKVTENYSVTLQHCPAGFAKRNVLISQYFS